MPLAPGARLGSYEVVSAIGVGGMGEVYRAKDIDLGRDVAIKVLPESFAHDADRLARFEREARTLASLNHPNIAIIHSLEKADALAGIGPAVLRALVMELVEGPTLADRIAQGPIPLDETLAIAKQIADALAAAHEQGIIHRDLKPANIKVRLDGTVKVLDFGLAKLVGVAAAVGPTASLSPTITTPAMTQLGVILGTAAYMSPEQAKGRDADKRSDVWAFGCVLYEMLTGRRAFDGEDVSDALASVLKSEPDWSAIGPDVAPAIRTLVRRCLNKDRRNRVADIAVVQFILAEVSALTASPGSTAGQDANDAARETDIEHRIHTAVAAARRTLLWNRVVPAFVILAAAIGGLAAWRLWRLMSPPSSSPVAFSLSVPQGQQFSSVGRQLLTISPDGRQVVYVATAASVAPGAPSGTGQRLYLRALSEFESRLIPGSEVAEGVGSPTFSPDGASIAFFSGGTLKRIPVAGGAPVTICPAENPYGMTWDSSGLVFGQARGIYRCPENGGAAQQLAAVDSVTERPHGAQILPGGDALLFTIGKITDLTERWDRAQIVVQSISSGTRTTIVNGGSDARYLSTGHLLYSVGGIAYAVPFDPVRRAVTGGAVRVVEGVRRGEAAQSGAAQLATSATGTLTYIPGPVAATSIERAVAVADRTGTVTRLSLPLGPYIHVRASRDGKRIAFDSDDGKQAIIYTHELGGTGAPARLTFAGRNRFPVWAPDGKRVAFQSDRDNDLAIFVQRVDGTGQAERLTKPEKGDVHVPESWSPDGRHISFSVIKGSTSSLWTVELDDKKAAAFGDVHSTEVIGSVFSPDGRWIAYHSRADDAGPSGSNSPSTGVYVQPFPATGARYQAPKLQIDFQPVWSPDGTELIYVPLAASGQMAVVGLNTKSGVTTGRPKLFPAAVTAGRTSGLTRAFDILPDGRFIGLVSGSQTVAEASASEIRVVLNWYDELNRLVPTK